MTSHDEQLIRLVEPARKTGQIPTAAALESLRNSRDITDTDLATGKFFTMSDPNATVNADRIDRNRNDKQTDAIANDIETLNESRQEKTANIYLKLVEVAEREAKKSEPRGAEQTAIIELGKAIKKWAENVMDNNGNITAGPAERKKFELNLVAKLIAFMKIHFK